jgi:hypothetical protein
VVDELSHAVVVVELLAVVLGERDGPPAVLTADRDVEVAPPDVQVTTAGSARVRLPRPVVDAGGLALDRLDGRRVCRDEDTATGRRVDPLEWGRRVVRQRPLAVRTAGVAVEPAGHLGHHRRVDRQHVPDVVGPRSERVGADEQQFLPVDRHRERALGLARAGHLDADRRRVAVCGVVW